MEQKKEVVDEVEERLNQICGEHKIFYVDQDMYKGLKLAGLLPLLENGLNKFLEQEKTNGFYIINVENPYNKEQGFGLQIKYEGGKEPEEHSDDKAFRLMRNDVLTLLALKQRNEATEMIVEDIERKNFIYTTRDDRASEMWIYRNGIYVPEGKSFVREYSRNILGKLYTTQLVNEIINKIEADTFIEHDAFFGTNYIEEVPVTNGILNIFTKELSHYTPKKIFFNKLPVNYNPNAKCPHILDHLKTVLKEEDDVEVMLEIFGYSLLKEYKIEKAFMFVGKGRNGKSKTLELIKRFVGAENCSNLPLASMRHDSFSLSELFGKMANLAGDLSNNDLKETGTIKNLIGRDTIQAKRKFLNDLFFVNYAKMVFAANELPKVYDMTDGFWTKWVLLEFPYKFITQKEYNLLTEEEKNNKKIINTDIIRQITTEGELSGLLNKSLEGLDRLIKNSDFSYSKGTKEVKDMWVRKSDSFMAFCLDCLEESENNWINKKELRKEYFRYCKSHKIKGTSDISIKITLQSIFGASEDRKLNEWGWEGIKFKQEIVKM